MYLIQFIVGLRWSCSILVIVQLGPSEHEVVYLGFVYRGTAVVL